MSGRGDWRLGPDVDPVAGAPEGSLFDPAEAAALAYRRALDKGLRALAMREHSRTELLQKLAGKGISRGLAAQVVDDLGARELQSDERFAESYVHGRVQRGYGPVWIRQALAQRGIQGDLADALLDQPREYWMARAEDARVRKFGEQPPCDRGEWQKQARFLAQRGFSTDLIARVLDRRD
jgi:regulatory protein